MKIGIFSDIHGNLPAFEKVYSKLMRERCDRYYFLGDICGYYFNQNEVIDMMREIPNLEAIAGNHDVLFLKAIESDVVMFNYTDRFGLSFKQLKENITHANLDYIEKLPKRKVTEDGMIGLFHGSPWSPLEEYVYPDAAMYRFDCLPDKYVFLGHTHRSMDIRRDEVRIINPGSSGQPRDGNWPTYAVLDTESGKAEIKSVPFDIDRLLKDIEQRNDTNTYIVDILRRIKQNGNK